MLHPNLVNIVKLFCPLGNTPAVCLTQDIPREQEANVLLLGCGDARNILFTGYSDSGTKSRKLDITCCDLEAAILARNIVLFTLIVDNADGSKDTAIWNIYYHVLLDKKSLELLRIQVAKLHSLSASIQNWHGSPYGHLLRMCDRGTLLKIRKVWSSYGTPDMSSEDKTTYNQHFESSMRTAREMNKENFGSYMNVTGFRLAAPLTASARKDLSEMFLHFWEHGITDEDRGQLSRHQNPNPMFAGSFDDACTLHHGTDPLLGFHLATAYASLNLDSPLKLVERSDLHVVVAAARLQFRNWSTSFRRLAQKNLTIRFFAGDALALCHTLQDKHKTSGESQSNWYRDQYHLDPLVLDSEDYTVRGNAPLLFNVIDTSSLMDHLGAINILVAASPLLDNSLSATLYTETPEENEDDPHLFVDRILCGHFPTISILFGLMPIEYWTNSSAVSSVEEDVTNDDLGIMKRKAYKSEQRYNRLTWKQCGLGSNTMPVIRFDHTELAHILFKVYLEMSSLHYHQGILAAFLRLVKKRVAVDWDGTIGVFISLVDNDSTALMHKPHLQELILQLHLLDLYTVPAFRPPFDVATHSQALKGLSAWNDIPPVICITLKVPRPELRAITEVPFEELEKAILQCSLQSFNEPSGRQWQNIFSVVQTAFGDISTTGSRCDDDFEVKVSEDVHGWSGSSSMIVSFLAPTWAVLGEPRTTIGLGIYNTQPGSDTVLGSLGPEMNVFRTDLGDEDAVYITKYRPNQSGHASVCNFKSCETVTRHGSNQEATTYLKANVDIETRRITTLIGHYDILSETIKASLRNRAAVKHIQISPCTIGIHIGKGGPALPIVFPAPVLRSQRNCRVARKSSRVEVEVSLADHRYGEGLPQFMYPVFPSTSGPVIWNMPRLNLKSLPILSTSENANLKWLQLHIWRMFSSREKHLTDTSVKPGKSIRKDARTNFKDSLFAMFRQFSGLNGEKARIFGIMDPRDGRIHLLLFVSCIRLDLANHTVVLDVAVLPLHTSVITKLGPLSAGLGGYKICYVKMDDDEWVLWRTIIPVWVERCRQWEHRPSCAYLTESKIPLVAEQLGRNPICSCGEGTLLSNPSFNITGWEVAAKHAVRAAISPSFSVPFVEESFKGDETKV